ncbi:GNAT family N-acetyltransferase [Novosphingobium sp. Gsoil 351]|uniref:GNAT family N-acetyltransferase n=1 Tax=Novosphingobium sp. Gsoil 351 TaxID=2675225 RepID=UPI0012B44971|nr:GNAT family N-acetyltransferase [Novosphingobium sp. Gsoil 351]QGN53508.1 GNAT family N-acetyltransferase [Novosphingobium sp. Gsoil 351]
MIDEIIHTALEDGTKVCLRSIRPTDELRMRQGIEQLSNESRYLRFFSPQRMPSKAVIERLIDADGHRHIAWGAIHSDSRDQPAIGAVHAVRDEDDSESAEFSVAIVDAFHGLGLARMLIAVLLVNCRLEHIETLNVQILSENRAARRLVTWLGAERCQAEYSVTEYLLDVDGALAKLRSEESMPGLKDVFAVLAKYL